MAGIGGRVACALALWLAACGGGHRAGAPDVPAGSDLAALDVAAEAAEPDGGPRPALPRDDGLGDEAGTDPGTEDLGDVGADAGDAGDPAAPADVADAAEVADDPGADPATDPGATDPGPDDPGSADAGDDPGAPDPGADPGTTDPGPGDPGADPGVDPGPGGLVNAVTDGDQSYPSLAARPGGWWVAWQTRPPSGGDWQVAGRCLAADGLPASPESRLSSDACTAARRPAVAVASDGALWVAYEADGLDGSGTAVAVRRLPSCDGPPGPEHVLNTFTDSFQGAPALAALGAGTVVAAWQSECRAGRCAALDGSWAAVAHRRAGPDGPLGTGESVANRFTIGDQYQPSLAAFGDGTWWVAWSGAMDIPSLYDVFVDRFDTAGLRVGEDVAVNAGTVGAQSVPRATALAGGGAVVAWLDWATDGTASDVRARILGADGVPRAGDLDLAADPAALESSVTLAADPDGGFRAAWRRREVPGGAGAVLWRSFGADGAALGGIRPGSGGLDLDAGQPVLAAGDAGTLLVFTSSTRDGAGTGIVAVPLP